MRIRPFAVEKGRSCCVGIQRGVQPCSTVSPSSSALWGHERQEGKLCAEVLSVCKFDEMRQEATRCRAHGVRRSGFREGRARGGLQDALNRLCAEVCVWSISLETCMPFTTCTVRDARLEHELERDYVPVRELALRTATVEYVVHLSHPVVQACPSYNALAGYDTHNIHVAT